MRIYRATLTLLEHTYFASRELGPLYQTEPLIGNYALAYALGLCQAPYHWAGGPRYKQDLAPLNAAGLYVTPATFAPERLRFAISRFNAQADAYWSRYDNNAISVVRGEAKKARAANFPQAGRLRLLGLGSEATFFLIDARDQAPRLPVYVRLGKFASKARIAWRAVAAEEVEVTDREVRWLLNAADLPDTSQLRVFHLHSIHPAPLVERARLSGRFYRLADGEDTHLPVGMRFAVEVLP